MAVFPAFFGLLMAALVTGQTVEITPKEAVVRVGADIDVLCKVPYAIDMCRMKVGNTNYRLYKPGNAGDNVSYFGVFEKGECGAHIRDIQEAWNGEISCDLPSPTGAIDITGTMKLIVAKAPQNPQLLTPVQPAFKEGEVFTAQCAVAGGRPAAKITWFLDNEELLIGVHEPIVTTAPDGDLQTITQNISRTLSADDGGRTLICKAEHEALLQPRLVTRQLAVHYAPKVESTAITIFGLSLNTEGRLNVTVRASPPPTAEWTVGGQKIRAPGRSDDGMISALEPWHLGNGTYNVTLVLEQVRKEDVDRTYYLDVHNELGRETLAVRISTMEEPAGVELDTGAIVGIVIAVLIVLIAISLVVFAFATDRWCFSGRRRDNPKSSGESSDTESAVGGNQRSRLAQLGARVRAALPRAKDKVQATEAPAQEEEDKPEDKVVYATLALSEQTPVDKPPPAFAEYAEIVYTDQGQKDVKETA